MPIIKAGVPAETDYVDFLKGLDRIERVDHPAHYNQGTIEVIDFIEDQKMDFRAASALKYLCRYRFKGKPLEDLQKSVWYINRIIQELERGNGGKEESK